MIKVFSFHPEHFNNNGDQGNLEALAYFTGETLSYVAIEDADFVLFGDASRAAMRHYHAELESMVPELERRLDTQAPTLLVGSAYEFYLERLPLVKEISYGERISEAREVTYEDLDVKGYRNSELVGPDFVRFGSFIGTTLFGPVLAKNPDLLKQVAETIGLNVQIGDTELGWIEKL